MTRREEIENHIVYQQTIAAFEYANQYFEDIHKISERNAAFNGFEAGAEWMQKTMIEKAFEYAEARYDLDYCGNVKDILNYLKSLVEG